MISWFQAFAFKWVNLHCYSEAKVRSIQAAIAEEAGKRWGSARWNQVDP
jgi:hypothetical protein